MAFGLLGSIIPQINRNEVVYTSPTSNLAVGKVSVSSKNYNPVKVRVGITSDDLNIEYFAYNRYVNYGETYETESLYVGNGQKLVVLSDNPDVNFVFYGQTYNEEALSQKSGMFNSVVSTDKEKKYLYTPPDDFIATVTLSVCNLDSQPAKARIGLGSTSVIDTFDSSEYLEYDVEIGPQQTYTRTDIKLSPPNTLVCSSSQGSNINFLCHGRLTFTGSTGGEENPDLVVSGNASISGSLGVGTGVPRSKLDVVGSILVQNDVVVGRGLTANRINSDTYVGILTNSSLNQSLINLGALPSMDGSALVGIVAASSSGIIIKDDDTPVGTSSTLNFGKNLRATFSAGIATITTTNNVDIDGNLTVATNKFSVNSSSGNTLITGTLGISSSLSVSGTVNTLNNKVINVGTATSGTDATNKKYVDTRSIAMSIALS